MQIYDWQSPLMVVESTEPNVPNLLVSTIR